MTAKKNFAPGAPLARSAVVTPVFQPARSADRKVGVTATRFMETDVSVFHTQPDHALTTKTGIVGARASWSAADLRRFEMGHRVSESAGGPAQSTTWRMFIAAVCLFATLFVSVAPLHAQPVTTDNPVLSRTITVLDLDGNGSYVELPPNIFSNLSEATIEGWVKWDSTGYYPRFWNFGGNQASQEVGLVEDSTDLLFGFSRPNDLGGFRVLNLTKLSEWYHLAAVSGKGGMKLYLNGVLVGRSDRAGSFDTIPGNTTNWIGRNTWPPGGGGANKDAKCQMAEFRVWSTARAEEQIRADLNRSLTGSEPGLFGLWNFTNVENGVVKDSGPHGFHGKLMGNARTTTAQLPLVRDSGATANGPDSGRTPVRVSQLRTIRGKVTDVEGKVLPGVTVRFEQEGREVFTTGIDRTTGEYSWVATFSGPICDIEVKDETGEFGVWKLGVDLEKVDLQHLDIVLKRSPRVSGSVVSLDPKLGFNGVVVQALRTGPNFKPWPPRSRTKRVLSGS